MQSPIEVGSKAFLEQLCREYVPHADLDFDQRSEPRYLVTAPIVVQPLDEQFQAVGPSAPGVTHDISASGLGLVVNQRVTTRYLRVILLSSQNETCALILEVLHQRGEGQLFRVGGRIL